ncbi:ModD protein [Telmatospirillum sp.]|uniref:ModD protein n=1 Tax=Telmatospirillum sp. TaxID=2079197 RepID=UPI00283CB417|nr:ModD protein [Telmatospirillum sp.]MDR3437287.1 ModD protein [Telmatospirillum sp.]
MLRLSDSVLEQLLNEDVPFGDLTSTALAIGERSGRMRFVARTAQVLCCVEEAVRLIELAGGQARAECRTGAQVAAGTWILEAEGAAGALLAAWKVAQNLIEATSGIATAVRALVAAAERGGGAVIACTRKNFPGTKLLAIKAVQAGGGVPHRLGLSDSILMFPEHRVFLQENLADAVARLRSGYPEKKVVAEVNTPEEALALAQAGIDVVQLEKFPPEQVAVVVQSFASLDRPPLVAAAGGVVVTNAEAYVRAGAQILVTSSPYWAKPTEVAVTIEAVG